MSAEDKVPPKLFDLKALLEDMSKNQRDLRAHVGGFAISEAAFVVLDDEDIIRCQLGKQADGTYGIKLWNNLGNLFFSQTSAG